MDEKVAGVYEFGPFRLDAQRRLITCAGQKVEVTPKAVETLVVLVESAGRVVAKDELLQRVWPDTYVEENNLTQCILVLRKALGETAGENKYIATVPGHGYRFVATVQRSSVEPGRVVRSVGLRLGLLAGILICGVVVAWHYLPNRLCRQPSEADYTQGIGKLEEMDYVSARDLLEEAAITDGKNPHVHARLADAWSGLGYDSKAKEEAREAFELARGCSSDERRESEARFSEAAEHWERAVSLYRELWEGSRDNIDYGLRLVNTLSEAGKAKEALAAVQALRTFSVSARYDPKVDLAEADIALSIPDSEMEKEAAERAIKKAEDSADPRAKQLISEALLHKGWALTALGQPLAARDAFEAALKNFSDAGNQGGRADALNGIADLLYGQGDLAGAEDRYVEALNVCRDTHYERCAAEDLCSLGDILKEEGNLTGAEQRYRDCLTSSEKVADKTGMVTARIGLSELMIERQRFAEAETSTAEAMKRFEGESTGLGILAFYNVLARALLAEGKAADARGLIEKTSGLKSPVNDRCASLSFEVTAARVRAASDDHQDIASALRILKEVAAESNRSSCYPVGLEARFAQAEIEVTSRRLTLGIDDLVALQKEARTKGFGLIARRAEMFQRSAK